MRVNNATKSAINVDLNFNEITIERYWKLHGLQPHDRDGTGGEFVGELRRDVVNGHLLRNDFLGIGQRVRVAGVAGEDFGGCPFFQVFDSLQGDLHPVRIGQEVDDLEYDLAGG